MTSYVPLYCKSNFSFLEGASHPAELIESAANKGLEAIALTDRDGFYGMVEAHERAKELDIALIVGAEVSVRNWGTINLYPMSRFGYGNLCELLSIGQKRTSKGNCRLEWNEIFKYADDVIALWGCDIPWGQYRDNAIFEKGNVIAKTFGDRLYIALPRHRLPEEPERNERLKRLSRELERPLAAVNEVLYHTPNRRSLQDLLTCIREGVTIHESAKYRKQNAEYGLKSAEAFEKLFDDLPRAIEATNRIASRCLFSLSKLQYRYPSEVGESKTAFERLFDLSMQGAVEKYGNPLPDEVEDQINRELSLIDELEYAGYFLTMKEIVDFCEEQNILCQGRGSAANSVVCYCLGITAIDPVRMELLFERFISRERDEPPDIDLDIEHDRREEVIQHVYDKYGRDRAAMVANVTRYRPKSAIRDIGKALGLKQSKIERLAESISSYEISQNSFENAGLDLDNHLNRLYVEHIDQILDFPRHLSLHPGGFLLGKHRVDRLVPVENASKEGRTCIQWDKYQIEKLGLFKVDLLGLGALTQLHYSFDLIEKHYDELISIDEIPAGDDKTYEMICEADTIGIFQIESRAQMSMLPRLNPRNYYDLVVEISLVRPGPIEGEMVHPYLKRRRGDEKVTYPHPSLKPVLEKTLGVPLFQEQVMKLAMVAADYTAGEADQLRRDMGFRSKNALEKHRNRMIPTMVENGIEPEYAKRIFKQIQGFGSYGFPESHAASFAIIAYATSYIRCHYFPAFVCSLLNAQPMGFYSVSTIVEDAKRHNLDIRPIDINQSQWNCQLEPSPDNREYRFAIRMGARFVDGLAESAWTRIEAQRTNKPFVSLRDFIDRLELARDTVDRLAEAGAFSELEENRRKALWRLKGLIKTDQSGLKLNEMSEDKQIEFDPLKALEEVKWDYQSTDHSTVRHPLEPLRKRLIELGLPTASQLKSIEEGRIIHYAGLVIVRQRPGTASGVCFLTLEDETGLANALLWPDIYEKYRRLARTEPFLGITGRIQRDKKVMHIIGEKLWRPGLTTTPPASKSYDFR